MKSIAQLRVMQALVMLYPRGLAGIDLIRQLNLRSGTVYPLLQQLERRGYLVSKLEKKAIAHRLGRPQRRTYGATMKGYIETERLLRQLYGNLVLNIKGRF